MADHTQQKNIIARYDEFPKWGKEPDEANRERIETTQSLFPEGIRTVLDLGCGDGIITNKFAEQGIEVIGIDFSAVALGFVKGKRLISGVDGIPFPSGYFDLVLCAETIEHLPDGVYERTISEIERVAGRYIIISTPNDEYLSSASIKCENCGSVFHRNLHVRTLNKDTHSLMFKTFKPLKTVGVRERRQFKPLIDFERSVLNVYIPGRGAICPNCNHACTRKPNIWQRAVLEAGRRITRLLPGTVSDRWIITLYQSG